MLIEPNTTVKFLLNCPLNKDYNHTLFFENKTQQFNYFSSLEMWTIDRQTYQRVDSRTIRVEKPIRSLINCNYMMFKNTDFENKWFYAFIDSVKYINNNTTEVRYEIDVIQTWFFDCTLKQCFVEREHSLTDNIGDNIVEEKIATGEYVLNKTVDLTDLTNCHIGVFATFNKEFEDNVGGLINGVYSGLCINFFDLTTTGVAECNAFLNEATERKKSDGIVAIMILPVFYSPETGTHTNEFSFEPNLDFFGDMDENIWYTPKNKKLFTYPYNFLYVSNMCGTNAVFPFELFRGGYNFKYYVDSSPNTSAILVPQEYKGVRENWDEKMTITNFPMCSYNIDAYKVYCAQNAVPQIISGVGSLASLGVGIATENPLLIAGGVVGISNILGGHIQAQREPPQSKGAQSPSTLFSADKLTFVFMQKQIRIEYAKIIDDFFSAYGYATNQIKVPNINSRPRWNYVKTIDCYMTGLAPSEAIKKICEIFNRGVTFWKNGDDIGNYNLDNSPLGVI